jgi:hypothetical protein
MLSLDGLLGVKVSPPFFLRRGGQTQKSSDLQKYKLSGRGGLFNSFLLLFILKESRHFSDRKSFKPLRSFLRNNSASAESVLCNQLKSKNLEAKKFRRLQSINHPGRESSTVIIPKSPIPATPP